MVGSPRSSSIVRPRGRRRYRRLLTLSSADRGLLVCASLTVVAMRLALWILPPPRVMRATLRLQRGGGGTPGAEPRLPERVAWAVRVVSRWVPGATCLTQALATQRLLARSGCASQLRLGVARDGGGTFGAHAWVEVEGRVIIGGGALDQYARLPDLTASP